MLAEMHEINEDTVAISFQDPVFEDGYLVEEDTDGDIMIHHEALLEPMILSAEGALLLADSIHALLLVTD
jgi:hypothetical protein